MPEVALHVLIILALIVLNGVFAMSEIAVVSARRAWLQQSADRGDARSRAALDLADSPNRFLSTIQIGITLIGIMAGAFGGATIAAWIADVLRNVPALARYAGALGLAVTIVATTYLTLVIGELVPKRLALNGPEKVARLIAPPMKTLSRLMSPVVFLLSASTDLVLKLLGVRGTNVPPITEEEVRVLVEQGTVAGVFEEVERDMLDRIFRLGERQVGALMRPRSEVVWIDVADPPDEVARAINSSSYSRYPVARDSLDDILGIVQVKDLLVRSITGKPLDLEAVLQEPLFVPENMRVFQVLELFKQSGLPIALVVDEYGIFQGLVTLDDILEGIVGEIPEVDEISEPQAIQREDGSWLLDGLLPVHDFKELFAVEELPAEGSYQSVAGFVLELFGRIPAAGEHFEWGGLRLEVLDMDGNRIDKVLVTPL